MNLSIQKLLFYLLSIQILIALPYSDANAWGADKYTAAGETEYIAAELQIGDFIQDPTKLPPAAQGATLGAQQQLPIIRDNPTSNFEGILHQGHVKVQVCNSIKRFQTNMGNIVIQDGDGDWKDKQTDRAITKEENVNMQPGEATDLAQIKEELFSVIHKTTDNELKNHDFFKDQLNGCAKLREFASKLKKLGDGEGKA